MKSRCARKEDRVDEIVTRYITTGNWKSSASRDQGESCHLGRGDGGVTLNSEYECQIRFKWAIVVRESNQHTGGALIGKLACVPGERDESINGFVQKSMLEKKKCSMDDSGGWQRSPKSVKIEPTSYTANKSRED